MARRVSRFTLSMSILAASGACAVAGATLTSAAAATAKSTAPKVTKVSPTKGHVGAVVTVTGSGFVKVTKVEFGTKPAMIVKKSMTKLVVDAPTHSLGQVDVRVVTKKATSAKTAHDHFTYTAAPKPVVKVTGVSPDTGGTGGGGTVTLQGSGFEAGAAVAFGATAATNVTVSSATTLTATAPAHAAGTVDVKITDTNGTSTVSVADHYKYVVLKAPYAVTTEPELTADDETAGNLGPISCGSPSSCAAVGFYENSEGEFQIGAIETLAGGAWTQIKEPLPNNGFGVSGDDPYESNFQNFSVACPAAGVCFTVSEYADSDLGSRGVINTLSSGTWAPITAPLPANASGIGVQLFDVSCLSADSCAAAGTYTDTDGKQEGLVETLANGSWTATETPAPSDAATGLASDNNLTQISCATATYCVASGDYFTASGHTSRWFATLDSGSWTAAAAVVPTDLDVDIDNHGSPDFDDVQCPAVGTCFAVGVYASKSSGDRGLIDTLGGGVWSTEAAPLPTNALHDDQGARLVSLACPTASACVTVGHYQDKQFRTLGLIESFSDQTATASQAPMPANADPQFQTDGLQSVSCSAAGMCTAVSNYQVSDGGLSSAFVTVENGVVQALQAPAPSGLNSNDGSLELSSISCPTQSGCSAAGTFTNASSDDQDVLETAT